MEKSESNLIIHPISTVAKDHYKLFLNADPSKKVINSYLGRAHKFELTSGKDLLGVLALINTRPETMEIVNIAVDESHQNHGLGEKMLLFAINWATENHYHTIEIGTGSTSFAQLYLYQKCGFRVVNIDRDFFVDNYDEPIIENNLILRDMIRLKKELP